ncbi:MAG: hypothetical protein AB1782_16105 [Cyanobacteriota bacterium]
MREMLNKTHNNINFGSKYIVYGNKEDRQKAVSSIKYALFANNVNYSYFLPLDVYEKKPIDQIMICTNDKNGNDSDKCSEIIGIMQKYIDTKKQILKVYKESFKDNPQIYEQFVKNFNPPIPNEVKEFLEEKPRFNVDLNPEHEASNINNGFTKKSFNPIDGKFYEDGSQQYSINIVL